MCQIMFVKNKQSFLLLCKKVVKYRKNGILKYAKIFKHWNKQEPAKICYYNRFFYKHVLII